MSVSMRGSLPHSYHQPSSSSIATMGQWNSSLLPHEHPLHHDEHPSNTLHFNHHRYSHNPSSAPPHVGFQPSSTPRCLRSSEFFREWKDPLTDLRPPLATSTATNDTHHNPSGIKMNHSSDAHNLSEYQNKFQHPPQSRRGFLPSRRHRIPGSSHSFNPLTSRRSEISSNGTSTVQNDSPSRPSSEMRNNLVHQPKSAPVSIRSDSDESMEASLWDQSNRRKKDKGRNLLDNISLWKNDFKLYNSSIVGGNQNQNQSQKMLDYGTYKALLEQRGALSAQGSPMNSSSATNEVIRKAEEDATVAMCERRLLHYQHLSRSLAKKRTSRMSLRLNERLKAQEILNSSEPSKVILEKFNIKVTARALRCLGAMEWCDDEVINFYMNLLQERNDKHVAAGEPVPKTFFWSTFFYTKMSGEDESGNQRGYAFNNVSRWTKRKKIDLFSYDLILVPVHIRKIHWTLGAIDMKNCRIHFFDSMNGSSGAEFCVNILQYIKDEHLDKKGVPLPNENDWIFDEHESYPDVPQQSNGSDCGVFVCQFCECLSDGRPLDFTQSEIPDMRLKMISQICEGEVK